MLDKMHNRHVGLSLCPYMHTRVIYIPRSDLALIRSRRGGKCEDIDWNSKCEIMINCSDGNIATGCGMAFKSNEV